MTSNQENFKLDSDNVQRIIEQRQRILLGKEEKPFEDRFITCAGDFSQGKQYPRDAK